MGPVAASGFSEPSRVTAASLWHIFEPEVLRPGCVFVCLLLSLFSVCSRHSGTGAGVGLRGLGALGDIYSGSESARGWRPKSSVRRAGRREVSCAVQVCADTEMQRGRRLRVSHPGGDTQPRGPRWGRNRKERSVPERREAGRWRPAGPAGAACAGTENFLNTTGMNLNIPSFRTPAAGARMRQRSALLALASAARVYSSAPAPRGSLCTRELGRAASTGFGLK